MQLGFEYNFEVSSFLGCMSDALGGCSLGNFETRIRMDNPLERDISVVGEATDNTVGGYADPSWSGTFDFIWSSENARIFWRTLWSARPYFDPTLNDVFATEDGGAVQKADARFMNNVTVSYNLDSFFPGAPETTMIQLGIGNVLNRKPDVIQEARGFYGTPELLGRNYTLTLQGNW